MKNKYELCFKLSYYATAIMYIAIIFIAGYSLGVANTTTNYLSVTTTTQNMPSH